MIQLGVAEGPLVGVYHFMGLGLSVGAVTGPLSYLAARYERYDSADQEFFSSSGEYRQREQHEKVGDVEAIVLFTTPEVFNGSVWCQPYIVNRPGACSLPGAKLEPADSMRSAMHKLLRGVLPPLVMGCDASGQQHKKRDHVTVYWCQVDRTNLLGTFERCAQMIMAAKSSGSVGKEIWINLTGGTNVVNLGLQLAAELTGQPARFYYVQAENDTAVHCVRHTREDEYWFDLPLLPVRADEAIRGLGEIVAQHGPLTVAEAWERAAPVYFAQFQDVLGAEPGEQIDLFWDNYVSPAIFLRLLSCDADRRRPVRDRTLQQGPAWNLVGSYYQTLDSVRASNYLLKDLVKEKAWLLCHELPV